MPRRGVRWLLNWAGAAWLGPALALSGCAGHRSPAANLGPAQPSGVPVSLAQAQPCQLLPADELRRLGVDPTVDPTAANLPGQCTYAAGAWALQVVSGAHPAWAYVTAVALAPSPTNVVRIRGLGDQAAGTSQAGGSYAVAAQRGQVGVIVAGSYPLGTLAKVAGAALGRLRH